MELIKEIFLQNAFASVKAAAVIILLFALTKPITKRYKAGFRYYSWLAVMLIFLIPFGFMGISYDVNLTSTNMRDEMFTIRDWYEDNVPEYTVAEKYNTTQRIQAEEGGKNDYVSVVKTSVVKKKLDVTAMLALIWISGAFAYLALHIGRYISFNRGLHRLSADVKDDRIHTVFEREKQLLGISKDLRLWLFAAIDTPLLTGLMRPKIILPHTDYTDDELHLIFRHELFHYKRRDILYQFITLVFVSLHWFNPFIYLMAKAVEADGETSCDEKTLEGKDYDEKIFYGEMLLKFLKKSTQKKSYMTTTFFGGKKGMKKRLTLIADKTTRKKGTAAMVLIMMISIVTSIGAAAMGNEYFDSVFDGDTSYLADFVKTEKKSVEDDRFKLTLEQYLVAENQAMIIYSFEAKTDDAVAELNDRLTFWDMDTIMFGPTDYKKAYCGGYGGLGTVGKELNTERKIYGCIASDRIKNEEKIDFYLSTDKIKGSPKIIIPMDYNMETKTMICGDVTVKYNPISIIVTSPASGDAENCDFCYYRKNNIYFRVKNGEIKTFNQLFDESGGHTNFDEAGNDKSYDLRAWAREIIKLDEIKSIIINDIEYPVNDTSKPKPVTIDDHLKPFIIDAYVQDHLWIPLRALCDGLGAEIKWDNDTKTASFNYRGSNYSFTVGKPGLVMNGEECDFGKEAPFIDEFGRMIVPPNFDGYNNYTYIAVDMHGYNAFIEDENGVGLINPDAKWHIVP